MNELIIQWDWTNKPIKILFILISITRFYFFFQNIPSICRENRLFWLLLRFRFYDLFTRRPVYSGSAYNWTDKVQSNICDRLRAFKSPWREENTHNTDVQAIELYYIVSESRYFVKHIFMIAKTFNFFFFITLLY